MNRIGAFDLAAICQWAKAIAAEAGTAIAGQRDDCRVALTRKPHGEPVTSADLLSDRILRTAIAHEFPGHRIVSEECETPDDDHVGGPLWILDPLDGTANFVHGHAHSAVSVAFALDGLVLAGVVHNPFTHETYWATRGGGAWLNGETLRASGQTDIARALIGTGFPHDRGNLQHLLRRLHKILRSCSDVRRSGAPSLDICWVARGWLDGYYETLAPWDMAAASLIAREAGARVGNVHQKVQHDLCGIDLVVATPAVFPALTKLLQEA